MPAHKVSISLPDDVADAVAAAARAEGTGVSAWLAAAARQRLAEKIEFEVAHASALSMVIEFEAIHGPLPAEAEAWADEVLADAGLESRDAR
jgi:hypothetical protein